MNAFVTYEQEHDGVCIHRVYVGFGDVRALQKKFYQEVNERYGPQPELVYVRDPLTRGVMDVDKESEQVLNNWRATIYAAKTPRKFGEWLVENHNWVECDEVHQEPD